MTEQSIQRLLFLRHRSAQFVLPNYTPPGWYECDLFVLSAAGYSIEYEIKLTKSDFMAEKKKRLKHEHLSYRDAGVPTRFFYVVPDGLVLIREVPDYAGLVYIDRGSMVFVRPAPRLSKDKVPNATMLDIGRIACHRVCWKKFGFQ